MGGSATGGGIILELTPPFFLKTKNWLLFKYLKFIFLVYREN